MKNTVVLGVTGGIAAYKAAQLVRALDKEGVSVYVCMTENATKFVTPLTFETLSKHPVAVKAFDRQTPYDIEHIALAQRADVLAVVPATANFLGKAAAGIADDLLTSVFLATKVPVLIAPAMNTAMYEHPATRQNIKTLKERGCHFVQPEEGLLACGDSGKGRLASVEVICARILELLRPKQDLKGRHVVITAGPTREYIDPVRYISNRSSGKMGYALCRAALSRGAKVTLVTGPTALPYPQGAEVIPVETTEQMYQAVWRLFPDAHAVIKAAAPADYRMKEISPQKIKKGGEMPVSQWVENVDIAKQLGEKKDKQVLVAFAAETENAVENAKEKCRKKNADFIVVNDITKEGAGFEVDTNIMTIVDRDGNVTPYPLMTKDQAADVILDKMVTYF